MKNDITLKNVSKVFKRPSRFFSNNKSGVTFTLKDISFEVKKGEILGIIGLNGSGKTTLLRTISGVYKPDKGEIKVYGKLAPLLQIGLGFRNEITAEENITMYGMLLGLSKKDIKNKITSILEFAELKEFRKMKIKQFSAGMRSRLAFSTAMQVNADIFLIDEILAVGDLAFREKSQECFKNLKEQGKTIIHTTHSLATVEEFSDRVLLLNNGKQIAIGEPREIIKKYKEIILAKKETK